MTKIGFQPSGAGELLCDNTIYISISESTVQHDWTKHTEVDQHFIKEKLEKGIIKLPFVCYEYQLTDMLSKVMNEKIFCETLDKLSIKYPTTQLEGEGQNKETKA